MLHLYRNQSIHLHCKSIDWFLWVWHWPDMGYDNNTFHGGYALSNNKVFSVLSANYYKKITFLLGEDGA